MISESSHDVSHTVDVVKFGSLRRIKTNKLRFFVLRKSSKFGKAKLEYFENEKKFALHSNPRRSILLSECFNVTRVSDKKYPYCFALFTKQDKFSVAGSSDDEITEWLSNINEIRRISRILGESSLYDQIWYVIVKNEGLGASSAFAGSYRMALSKYHISYLKENSDEVAYQIPIANVLRRGQCENYFYMEISRTNDIGPGEVWIEVEDADVAKNIYDVIFGLRRSRIHTHNGSNSSRRVSSKKLNHFILEKGFAFPQAGCHENDMSPEKRSAVKGRTHNLSSKSSFEQRFSQVPDLPVKEAIKSNRPLSLDFEALGIHSVSEDPYQDVDATEEIEELYVDKSDLDCITTKSKTCLEILDEKQTPKKAHTLGASKCKQSSTKYSYAYEDMTLGTLKSPNSIKSSGVDDDGLNSKRSKQKRYKDGYEQMDIISRESNIQRDLQHSVTLQNHSDDTYVKMSQFNDRSMEPRTPPDLSASLYMNCAMLPKSSKSRTLPRYDYIHIETLKKKEQNPIRRSSSADLLFKTNPEDDNVKHNDRPMCASLDSLNDFQEMHSNTTPPLVKRSPDLRHFRSHTLNVSPNSSSSPGQSPSSSPLSSPKSSRRRLIDFTKHLRFKSPSKRHLKKQLTMPSSTFYVSPEKSKSRPEAASIQSYHSISSLTDTTAGKSPDLSIIDQQPKSQYELIDPINTNLCNIQNELDGKPNKCIQNEMSSPSGYEEIIFSNNTIRTSSKPKDIIAARSPKTVRRRGSAPLSSNSDYHVNFSPSKLKSSQSTKVSVSPLQTNQSIDQQSHRNSQRKADKNQMYTEITLDASPASPTLFPPLNKIPEAEPVTSISRYMNFTFNRSFSIPTDDDSESDTSQVTPSYENVNSSTIDRKQRKISKGQLSYAKLDLLNERQRSSSTTSYSNIETLTEKEDCFPVYNRSNSTKNGNKLISEYLNDQEELVNKLNDEAGDNAEHSISTRYFEVDFMKSRGLADAVKNSRSNSVQSDS